MQVGEMHKEIGEIWETRLLPDLPELPVEILNSNEVRGPGGGEE
jgi:hypothetical protein